MEVSFFIPPSELLLVIIVWLLSGFGAAVYLRFLPGLIRLLAFFLGPIPAVVIFLYVGVVAFWELAAVPFWKFLWNHQ